MKKILTFAAVFISMFIIDFVWIGIIMQSVYIESLGNLLLSQFKILPLLLFYVFYAISVLILVIQSSKNIKEVVIRGAWLGFCSYMTFELVNYGILADWPLNIVVVDIIWGTILTVAVSLIGFKIFKKI